ncbi:MAG: diaminopimelate decarboxylase [Firmicutes bacterium]|nr:diaminopimelate decarboxylase [Bacillota bacterium]
MGICSGLRVNGAGHLEMGGVDLAVLAKRMGTPLYVLDESFIRAQCRRYREAFTQNYPHWDVAYASKALSNRALVSIMHQEGLSLDVVSGGELHTAVTAGFPPERIYFHGNNKSDEEIALGLDYGVGRFVVDSAIELEVLGRLAAARGRNAAILIRVRPGIEAHCHHYVQTGTTDSKFGVSLREAAHLARSAARSGVLAVKGIHCHIGSQILETKPFEAASSVMVQTLVRVRSEIQRQTGAAFAARDLPDELSLGGGLGVADATGQRPPSIEDYVKSLCRTVKEEWRKAHPGDAGDGSYASAQLPRIIIEPGRSIINGAGVTLYTVGGTKLSGNRRNYVFVDGGMGDNPRPALYGARYTAALANRAGEAPETEYRVVGKCCESGDVLIEQAGMPRAHRGDILVTFGTGAYNYSMASNYNRLPRPAMVLVRDGKWDVIVKRETFEHLTALDVVPPRLHAWAWPGAAERTGGLGGQPSCCGGEHGMLDSENGVAGRAVGLTR